MFRRLYECLSVHARSSARMNLLHYLVGYAHYTCVALAVVSEAPGFTPDFEVHGEDAPGGVRWLRPRPDWARNVGAVDVALVLLFLAASYLQHRSFRILADLRKKKTGGDSGYYGIPRGGGFELVSCPHYACEVVNYTCFAGLLGSRHRSVLLVLLWVAANQTVAALMSHFWYQDAFPNYPRRRRAIVPFLL